MQENLFYLGNVICLLVGKSGSGKTTLANELEKRYGFKQLKSYTTRKPRYQREAGHIFLTEKEFDSLEGIIAQTVFDGNRYAATEEQVNNADIYVIDVQGIQNLLRRYRGRKEIKIVYLDVPAYIRFYRMVRRGDSCWQAVKRIFHDRKAFADMPPVDIVLTREKQDFQIAYVVAMLCRWEKQRKAI